MRTGLDHYADTDAMRGVGEYATDSIAGSHSPLPITSRVKSYLFAGMTRLSRSSG